MKPDFASATMLRLLLRGMEERGLQVPLPLPVGARVPHEDKRRVVAAIVAQGGLSTLLMIAREVQHIEGEPLHQVLVTAQDPRDFMRRWQRLERFIHATHRVQVDDSGPAQLTLRHMGAAPQTTESLAVLGVLIGGFEALGTQGLQVQVGGHAVHPQADEGTLRALAANDALRTWQLQWRAVIAPSIPTPQAPADLLAALPWPPVAQRLARHQLADPSAALRLVDMAQALGVSGRSLQRQLAAHGLSFSGVIAETRARLAAWCLSGTTQGLAEIGFLCGFADQAHFTREFTRQVGLPPARFRQAKAH